MAALRSNRDKGDSKPVLQYERRERDNHAIDEGILDFVSVYNVARHML